MRRLSLALLAAVAGSSLATPAFAQSATTAAPKIDPALAAAVADPLRKDDAARDVYRKPDQTLAFFDVGPAMKVGEYAPGGGWYSRLLGIYLAPKGKLVGLFADASSAPAPRQEAAKAAVAKFPTEVAEWAKQPAEKFSAFSLGAIPDGEKGTFDRILVMRALHNMLRGNVADSEIKKMRDLLKPDGMIGIEQHRAKADAPYDYTDGSKGYLREADIIKFMEIHGFAFVGKSEANANPKDSANWPEGVWTLPPVLGGAKDDAEKARLKAIGESDRMTLLFRKRP
ncbi:MAG: methyltransferase [Novosphingobium sp. 17-62-19]|uniref:class I SAM-dependent methyltransferase n=1 Tax=Novosphingobium sp. 17-62-19 TaxID=1970406 RepID=UPI000BCC97B6|nr:methyltransferase [Novosphingobium sp. 17-62-19]OYX95703.1 MAG: methyltransferase [Novosphingobium sp. 35-62-5]OZA19440.1 MAG: methyltransferase [Novosphingobium sp. 17-62-19]OZA72408.1 MAG: methyltransferase [Sphingomonadales bacterium 39-62-4]HQS98020.1 methyltransferase [Novosphingobium sp.]